MGSREPSDSSRWEEVVVRAIECIDLKLSVDPVAQVLFAIEDHIFSFGHAQPGRVVLSGGVIMRFSHGLVVCSVQYD